jgi:hypothetical protein
MRKIAHCSFAACIVVAVAGVYGQSSDAKTSLQQALNGQFTLTKLSKDRNDIVSAGSVLVLQKDGLMMYSTASPMPPSNTYKNGKISQGMGGFGRDLAIGISGGSAATEYPQRKFVTGETFWVAGISVGKDGIVLDVYSDPFNDIRYYAQLKIPFDKRTVPSADDALAKIAEVVTIQAPDNSPPPPPTDSVPPGTLQNGDILKMVKAGLDDSIIVAKIKTSKCQFDTTPDTLITLKQSGVSATVMRAMTQVPHE